MTVENYHLKWDSHLSHLNTSIATLYRNDKFSDVMLYSSSPENGFPRFGISAHKFILSSSSQFFASIFDSTLPASYSGVFHIVLPPDLTQRTIQILVQYMYSGEATVPNDILSEVLRGGELLKIRGLCRASPTSTEMNHESQKPYPKSNPIENSNCTRFANELRGLGASVLPEESPVIVKSPKPPQMGLIRIVNCNSLAGGISVNKEVAIDPDPDEGKCCYQESSPHCPPIVRASCRESGCAGCPDPADMERPTDLVQPPKLTLRGDLHHSSQSIEEKANVAHNITYRRISLPIDPASSVKPLTQPSPNEQLNCFQIKEEPLDCWHVDQSNCDDSAKAVPKIVLKLKVPRETVPAPIKLEAHTSGDEECSEPPSDSVSLMPYTRLVCDICKKSFDEPKAWVRHIEGHMEKSESDKNLDTSSIVMNQQPSAKTSYVPKKRRRTSPHENPDAHVTLMCDLCKMSFSTPAEWVRHLNTQHTETELAVFNNQRHALQEKRDTELVRYSRRNHSDGMFKASVRVFHRNKLVSQEVQTPPARDLDKICDVCTKRFPSNSVMEDHRRAHQGD